MATNEYNYYKYKSIANHNCSYSDTNLKLKWFIDCMFEFILCINWKKCSLVPLKALVLVSLAGQVREIALQTKRGFPCFS